MKIGTTHRPRMRRVFRTCKHVGDLVVLLSFTAILTAGWVGAVPAAPGPHALVQPDGTTFQAHQWGDEWMHGWETLDGFTIVQDDGGTWHFATRAAEGALQASERVVARDAPPEGTAPHLRPGGQFLAHANAMHAAALSAAKAESVPATGAANVPVFLITFADTNPTYSPSDFNSLLFGSGTKSMRDYYTEVSYGKFTVSAGPGGIQGWFRASNSHDYYGSNNASISGSVKDTWPGDLVYEAVAAADAAGFNFAPYDNNGDCAVDVVDIIHQGSGEDSSGLSTDIWSHHWSLSGAQAAGRSHFGAYVTKSPCAAGGYVKVDEYAIQPELLGTGLTTMGVFAHEFGHALGLPDLYDTDGSSQGIGKWSLMAAGNWCGGAREGDTPCHLDAWSKVALWWVSPHQATGTLTNQPVAQAETTPDIYQLLWGSPTSGGEYFLVENRERVGFDAYLPGQGLAIWHIDESMATSNGKDNANECYPGGPSCALQHYRVALVQADGRWDLERNVNPGDPGDLFPGSTNKTELTLTTVPSSALYSGRDGGVRVRSISTPASTMTATLAAVTPCTYSVSPTSASVGAASGSGTVSVTAGSDCPWTASSNAAWISITTGTSGVGSGSVSYSVQANGITARSGSLTVAGQTVTVSQAAAAAGPPVTIFSDTFEGSFPGSWRLWRSDSSATVEWGKVTCTSASGSGSAWCAAGGATPQPACSQYVAGMNTWMIYGPFSLADAIDASAEFDVWYNTETYNPTTSYGDRFWYMISVDGTNYRGYYTSGNSSGWAHKIFNFRDVTDFAAVGASQVWFAFAFDSDASVQSQGAYVDNVVITKVPAATCAYSISPASQSFPSAGGAGSVSVTLTSGTGCAWTASSNASWVTVTSGSSGSGNGTVGYAVAANSGSARSGTATIAGQTFTVSQVAASCSYTLSPTSASVGASGGAGSFTVNTGAGCPWTAASGAGWLHVTGGSTGSGPGSVSYVVDTNSGLQRAGSIVAGGQVFTVNQTGGPTTCTSFTISPTSASVGAVAGAQSVGLTGVPSSCQGGVWSAAGNGTWIAVSPTSGSGPGAVTVSWGQNTTMSARAGSAVIAGQVFNVAQSAQSCAYSLTPTSGTYPPSACGGVFTVNTTAGCPWTASTAVAWIHVTTPSGSGSASVSITLDANGGSSRTGTISVAGLTFAVNQSGAGSSGYTYWIPVASHGNGLNGSQWRSDLGLLNVSPSTATVRVTFFGDENAFWKQLSVPSGVQLILRDAVSQIGASGSGPIQVNADQPLKVTGRSYNSVSSDATCYGGGTQGQDYPAVATTDGLATQQSAYLPGLSENAAYRCNIGLVNTGSTAATVLVELFDGTGTALGSYTVWLAGGSWSQSTQPFWNLGRQTGMDAGYAKVTVQSGFGVFAFASVIDNKTNDATTVAMQ
jgi:immune inhibitor A